MLAAELHKSPAEYKTTINPITASEMAHRSAAARRTKSSKKLTAKSALTELDYHSFIKTYGVRIQFMLHRCSILFDKSRSGTEAERVASAIAKLFDVWADITQTPRRGILRPEKMKKLLRDYGMKSALDKMLAQPSIVMSEDATKEKSAEQPIAPLTEQPTAPQETPPTQPTPPTPDTTQPPVDDDDGPEPDATSFAKENEDSLKSQADPSPHLTPPPPKVEG